MEGQGPGELPHGWHRYADFLYHEDDDDDESRNPYSFEQTAHEDPYADLAVYQSLAYPVHTQEEFRTPEPNYDSDPDELVNPDEIEYMELVTEVPEEFLEGINSYWGDVDENAESLLFDELNPPPLDMAIDARDFLIEQGVRGAERIPREDPRDIFLRDQSGDTYEVLYVRRDPSTGGVEIEREPVGGTKVEWHYEMNRARRRGAKALPRRTQRGHIVLVVSEADVPSDYMRHVNEELEVRPFPHGHAKYGPPPPPTPSPRPSVTPSKPSGGLLSKTDIRVVRAPEWLKGGKLPSDGASYETWPLDGKRLSTSRDGFYHMINRLKSQGKPYVIYRLAWADHAILAYSSDPKALKTHLGLSLAYLQKQPYPEGHAKYALMWQTINSKK